MISSVNFFSSVQQIGSTSSGRMRGMGQMPPMPPAGAEDFQASPMGQLMSLRASLSTEDQSALDDFMKQTFEQMDSSSFDAASAAENAPQALKDYAAENGIDIEQMLSDMKNMHDEMKAQFESQGYDKSGMRPPSGADIQSLLNMLNSSSNSKN